MAWYDRFAAIYDTSVERLYVDARQAAAEALELEAGCAVLDVPCGTGQSMRVLYDRAGERARYVGVDLSSGMLAKARAKVEDRSRVTWIEANAGALERATLGGPVDRLHIFLGLSVFDRWEQTFEHLFGLLEPGGWCVVVDCYAEKPGLQGRLVQWTAGADLTRRGWEPLQRRSQQFELRDLPSTWEHGGTLFLARGRKPGGPHGG